MKYEQWKLNIWCSVETQEVLDAELSARVLQLVNVMDSGLHTQVYISAHIN